MKKVKSFIICLFLGLLFLSCATNQVRTSPAEPLVAANVVSPPGEKLKQEYYLQIGDTLDIKFFYNPELNERVLIRPDGKISMQLIDELQVAGLTSPELVKILTEKYSKVLKHPEVTVIVKEFSGQKVYVGGEVSTPGMIPIAGNLTALQAIFQAGGFKNTANIKSVVILSNQGTAQPQFRTINLKRDLYERTQQNDILLKPYDIVFVPKTTIAELNQFVDQYFEKLIPITKTFGFSYFYGLNPVLR